MMKQWLKKLFSSATAKLNKDDEGLLPTFSSKQESVFFVREIDEWSKLKDIPADKPLLYLASASASVTVLLSLKESRQSSLNVEIFADQQVVYSSTFLTPELDQESVGGQLINHPNYKRVSSWLESRHNKSSKTSVAGMPGWAVALLAGLLLVLGAVIFGPQPGTTGANKVAMTSGSDEVVTMAAPRLSPEERVLLATATTMGGIEWRKPEPGDAPFVIFSDPNCPSCQQLEALLPKLPKGLAPIIVPVAFKAGSQQKLESLYCESKPNGSSWIRLMGGTTVSPAAPKACQDAELAAAKTIIDKSNVTFLGLRLNATPAIVAPNGSIAQGAEDFDGLVKWLQKNSK